MELQLNTPQQHFIADLLWAARDNTTVNQIVAIYGVDAIIVRDMMMATALDDITDVELASQMCQRWM